MSLAPPPKIAVVDNHALRLCRPLISQGQVLRVTLLALVMFGAWLWLAGPGRTAEMPDPAGFAAFRAGVWHDAARRGVSRPIFEAAFEGVEPDAAILAKTTRQPEITKTIPQYLAGVVTPERIATGRAEAAARRETLERIEQRYGTDSAVVLGVWGIESNFGTRTGDIPTVRALATLAFARYRGDYFRRELLDALDILQAGHVAPRAMLGSWAGAMGQTQFMPSSFKRYAVDFDGDGHKDIWRNVPDALGSTAAYLAPARLAPRRKLGLRGSAPLSRREGGRRESVRRLGGAWNRAGGRRRDAPDGRGRTAAAGRAGRAGLSRHAQFQGDQELQQFDLLCARRRAARRPDRRLGPAEDAVAGGRALTDTPL